MGERIRPVGDIEKAVRAVKFEMDIIAGETPANITSAVACLDTKGIEPLQNMKYRDYLAGMRIALDYVLGSDDPTIDGLVHKFRYAVRSPFGQPPGDPGEVALLKALTTPLGPRRRKR